MKAEHIIVLIGIFLFVVIGRGYVSQGNGDYKIIDDEYLISYGSDSEGEIQRQLESI